MPPMGLIGVVTKVGFMQKTATVTVSRWLVHRKTHKRIERTKKYLTHDEENSLKQGDTVLIRNCPPVSARKRFRLEKIIKSPETEWQRNFAAGVPSNDEGGESETSRPSRKEEAKGNYPILETINTLIQSAVKPEVWQRDSESQPSTLTNPVPGREKN